LNLDPAETYEYMQYYIPDKLLAQRLKRLCCYFAYNNLTDLKNYTFQYDHVSTDTYVDLYENNKSKSSLHHSLFYLSS